MTTHPSGASGKIDHLYRWMPLVLFLLSLGLHAWGIGSDLPFRYNPDEPHHLHIAARFSSGDLNPHDFKYPALWQYVLAGWLGILYAGGRLLGLTHGALEFAGQFFYAPTVFYLTARLLASSLIALTAVVFFKLGKRFYDQRVGTAAGLLVALSPALNGIGIEATNYPLMIFLAALAIYQAHRLPFASPRAYAVAGLLTGLAVATHYLAAPLLAIPVLIALLHHRRKAAVPVAICLAAAGLGFFLGSPFVLLDFKTARRDIAQIGEINSPEVWGAVNGVIIRRIGLIGLNIARFLDGWGLGFALALLAFADGRRSRRDLLIWWTPLLLLLPILLKSHFGYLPRYSFAVVVPMFVPAALGLAFLWDMLRFVPARITVVGALLIALLFQSMNLGATRSKTDTATLAEAWMRANIPAGASVFIADPYVGPQLRMTREQTERLWKKCESTGHPRKDYYRLLTLFHPGGGYDIYQLRRSYEEVTDIRRRTDEAYEAVDWIDPVTEGLDGFIKRRVHWVVINRYVTPRHQAWVNELRSRYPKVAAFETGAAVKGRSIEIYHVSDELPAQ